jgi:hypothetical protein
MTTIVTKEKVTTVVTVGVQGPPGPKGDQGEGITVAWGAVTGTLANQTDLNSALSGKSATGHNHSGTYEPANANIQTHVGTTGNPHGVTKSDVGLGNCDNTSDANKPVSSATQTALDLKVDESGGTITNYLNFTPSAEPAYQEGRIWYDTDKKALSYYSDISGSSLQIGFEQWIKVRNNTGSTILDGEVVKLNGAQGQTPTIAKAVASADSNYDVLGVATSNMNDNQVGLVTLNGILHGLDTSGSSVSEVWADGDPLFLHSTVAGKITKVKPVAPNNPVSIGYVLYAHGSNGKILVRVLAAGVTDDQIIVDPAPFVGFFDNTDTSMHTILNKMDVHNHNGVYATAGHSHITSSVAASYTASGTTTIAYAQDAIYYATCATAVSSWAITGLPSSGTIASWTVELTNGGLFAQTWFANTKWDGGTIPTLTASGVDILTFYTRDAGTTIRGFVAAKDSK